MQFLALYHWMCAPTYRNIAPFTIYYFPPPHAQYDVNARNYDRADCSFPYQSFVGFLRIDVIAIVALLQSWMPFSEQHVGRFGVFPLFISHRSIERKILEDEGIGLIVQDAEQQYTDDGESQHSRHSCQLRKADDSRVVDDGRESGCGSEMG